MSVKHFFGFKDVSTSWQPLKRIQMWLHKTLISFSAVCCEEDFHNFYWVCDRSLARQEIKLNSIYLYFKLAILFLFTITMPVLECSDLCIIKIGWAVWDCSRVKSGNGIILSLSEKTRVRTNFWALFKHQNEKLNKQTSCAWQLSKFWYFSKNTNITTWVLKKQFTKIIKCWK